MTSSASQWSHVLSAAELAAHYELTASLDPSFARRERDFYESRTAPELRALQAGAWNACQADTYQMARSYLAQQVQS